MILIDNQSADIWKQQWELTIVEMWHLLYNTEIWSGTRVMNDHLAGINGVWHCCLLIMMHLFSLYIGRSSPQFLLYHFCIWNAYCPHFPSGDSYLMAVTYVVMWTQLCNGASWLLLLAVFGLPIKTWPLPCNGAYFTEFLTS